MPQPVSISTVRALAAALGLDIPDADLDRLRPEIESLWHQAQRLRGLPIDEPVTPSDRAS